jgi:hypothetical protein
MAGEKCPLFFASADDERASTAASFDDEPG